MFEMRLALVELTPSIVVRLWQIGTINYMSPESVIRSENGQQMAVSAHPHLLARSERD
jgi:hypothetical protein